MQRLVLCLEEKNFQSKYNNGNPWGQIVQWKHLVAGAVAVILHFLSCRALSFILSTSLPCPLRGKQSLRAWKYVRRSGWTEVQDVMGRSCVST